MYVHTLFIEILVECSWLAISKKARTCTTARAMCEITSPARQVSKKGLYKVVSSVPQT